MAKAIGSPTKYPARFSVMSYIGLILIGATLLAQPFSVADQKEPYVGCAGNYRFGCPDYVLVPLEMKQSCDLPDDDVF